MAMQICEQMQNIYWRSAPPAPLKKILLYVTYVYTLIKETEH